MRQTYMFSGAAGFFLPIFLPCRIGFGVELFFCFGLWCVFGFFLKKSTFLKQFIVFFSVDSAAIISGL